MGRRMCRVEFGAGTAVVLRAVWATLLLGLAAAAWAQTPEPPVRPIEPPVRKPPEVPVARELAPPVAPPNRGTPPERAAPRELGKPEDELRLDVARYAVDDDAPAELRAALPALTARFTGAQRGFEDLVGAAAEVTRFLQRELGYYLGYAYLPEQVPQGGVIRIAVLEGRLDKVELVWRNNLPVNRAVVEAYLARLQPGSVLKVRDVERVVFLVNDLRGMTARFELRSGSLPGTATMVVTAAPESVYQGRIDLDRNGTDALGLWRLGGLLQVNSPFGRGDGFTATALSTTTGGLKFALLGYNTPLGNDGFKLGASLSLVDYQLDKKLFELNLHGKASTVNVYGLYPLVRSRNLNLFALGSADRKAYSDTKADFSTDKDVDLASLGITGDFRDSLLGGGVNTFDATLSRGRLNYANSAFAAEGDDARFTKLTYGFTRLQDLVTNRALIYVAARGQVSRNNLDTTEQFRVGGPDGVRALNSGEGTGDMGVVLTGELRLLPPEAWFGRTAREMVFSLFGDAGYVQFRYRPDTSTPEARALRNHAKFAGAGLGFTWVRPGGYSLRLAAAKPVRGVTRQGEKIESVRAWLQAAMLFN